MIGKQRISRKSCGGFTVVELMITASLAILLTSVGTPTMVTAVHNSQVRTTTNDLFASLHLARSESIKRNGTITVVANSGGWAYGWSIRSGATVIRQQDAIEDLTITTISAGVTSIVFDAEGRATNTSAVTLVVSKTNSSAMIKCITLSSTQRAFVLSDKDYDGDCTNG
ncbi:MAG: GspH/FimT family protein [Pseudomonadales bacterium]|nr:GspH/FimT family protein [Pseudomonadales bacterium]